MTHNHVEYNKAKKLIDYAIQRMVSRKGWVRLHANGSQNINIPELRYQTFRNELSHQLTHHPLVESFEFLGPDELDDWCLDILPHKLLIKMGNQLQVTKDDVKDGLEVYAVEVYPCHSVPDDLNDPIKVKVCKKKFKGQPFPHEHIESLFIKTVNFKEVYGDETKDEGFISLRDYGIIPNTYNQYRVFFNLNDALRYASSFHNKQSLDNSESIISKKASIYQILTFDFFKWLIMAVIMAVILMGLTGCATPATYLRHGPHVVKCGGSMAGSAAGGLIGYHIEKSQDEECVTKYKQQGYKETK